MDACLAERCQIALVRHFALDAPVQVLVLEEQDRVRVLDRAHEQPFCIFRGRGAHDLEPGDVGERALGVLRVERPSREAAAGWQPQHDRHRRARAVALLGRHRDEVVPGARDEVGELHLRDGPHPHQGGPGRACDDRRLREGHVDHAPGTELVLEPQGDLEGAAVDAHVLAEHEHPIVTPHLLSETVADRLQVGLLGHALVAHL